MIFILGGAVMADSNESFALLLDDFADADNESKIGTTWEGFTDRVMGGRSDMQAEVVATDIGPVLRMTGSVSLANNGGFIQVRLPLSSRGSFDAGDYSGFRLRVRGSGDQYFLHTRTSQNIFPWAHFVAGLPVTEEWQTVDVPFTEFRPESSNASTFDISRLKSVAIVAAKAEFEAEIEVSSIGLYR
jgi:hypothetical protein